MSDFLRVTIRFLQPTFHGRNDVAASEWPPSPLRLFQALVAASAARWNERLALHTAVPALTWLQELPPPVIVACSAAPSEVPTLFYVPENSADGKANAWKGGDIGAIVNRSEKVVIPVHLKGDTVHYLFPMSQPHSEHVTTLREAARSVTHLGWGIDLVTADVDRLPAAQLAMLDG